MVEEGLGDDLTGVVDGLGDDLTGVLDGLGVDSTGVAVDGVEGGSGVTE